MKAEYKREWNQSFLILEPESTVDLEAFPVRMLETGSVPNLLPCKVQMVDERPLFYYDVTGQQSVADWFEVRKLSEQDLKRLLAGVFQILEDLKEYLMSAEDLVLEIEELFVRAEDGTVSFCYLPGWGRDSRKALVDLMEQLLPKMEHGDLAAVSLGYDIYKCVLEPDWKLEQIKEILYSERESAQVQREPAAPPKEEREDLWDDLFGEDSSESERTSKWTKVSDCPQTSYTESVKRGILKLLPAVLVAAALTGFAAARFYGYTPGISLEAFLGIIIAGIAVTVLGYALYERTQRGRARVPKTPEMPDLPDFRNPLPVSEELFRETVTEPGRFRGYTELNDEEPCEETELLYHVRIPVYDKLLPTDPGFPEIVLDREILVIGKWKKTADVCLENAAVSRVHARISRRGDAYTLTDLHSRNGTKVNGILLKEGEEHILTNGDLVCFAEIEYRYEARS